MQKALIRDIFRQYELETDSLRTVYPKRTLPQLQKDVQNNFNDGLIELSELLQSEELLKALSEMHELYAWWKKHETKTYAWFEKYSVDVQKRLIILVNTLMYL